MAFRCPFCHSTSNNQTDERERYCVCCHVFMDEAIEQMLLVMREALDSLEAGNEFTAQQFLRTCLRKYNRQPTE